MYQRKVHIADRSSTASNALVTIPSFENAIETIQNGKEQFSRLTEKLSVRHLKVSESEEPHPITQQLNFAKFWLAASKKEVAWAQFRSSDLRFVLQTSNLCEKIFSTAGYTLNDRRKASLPTMIEMQLLLHANLTLGGLADV